MFITNFETNFELTLAVDEIQERRHLTHLRITYGTIDICDSNFETNFRCWWDPRRGDSKQIKK